MFLLLMLIITGAACVPVFFNAYAPFWGKLLMLALLFVQCYLFAYFGWPELVGDIN